MCVRVRSRVSHCVCCTGGYIASGVAVVSSILVSFAAGTFVYVAAMEIMTEEFSNPHHKWTKLSLLLSGFAFMSVLGLVM